MLEAAATRMSSTRIGDIDLHLVGEGRHERSTRSSARTSPTRASRSRCGRRTRRRSRSSASGTAGTAARTRWSSAASSGIWETVVRRRARGRALPLRDHDARRARCCSSPIRTRSRPRSRRATRRASSARVTSGATTSGSSVGAGREPYARPDVDLRGASRLVAAHARQPDARLPRARGAARRLREGPRLHARRAAAGDGASVQRLVGLPGHRLLRADRALRRSRTTSARSSTSCTGRRSA